MNDSISISNKISWKIKTKHTLHEQIPYYRTPSAAIFQLEEEMANSQYPVSSFLIL